MATENGPCKDVSPIKKIGDSIVSIKMDQRLGSVGYNPNIPHL